MYQKTQWNPQAAPGISAARLNNMEDGIYNANVGNRLQEVVYYKSSDQFNKTDYENLAFIRVTVVGGGGSGGGVEETGSGERAEGSGGAGGGTAIKIIEESELSNVTSVTVGAGGSGAGDGQDGNSGGSSSFGSFCIGNGGPGGVKGEATDDFFSGDRSFGGTASGGDLNIQGGDGSPGICSPQSMRNNSGGGSHFAPSVFSSATFTLGRSGREYGGGSTGGRNGTNGDARGSLAGGDGLVIVEVYS